MNANGASGTTVLDTGAAAMRTVPAAGMFVSMETDGVPGLGGRGLPGARIVADPFPICNGSAFAASEITGSECIPARTSLGCNPPGSSLTEFCVVSLSLSFA